MTPERPNLRRTPRLPVATAKDFDGIETDENGNLPKGYVSNYQKAFEIWEKRLFRAYLEAYGRPTRAAKELGIHRNTLRVKLIRYGFTDSDLKNFRDGVMI
jgi:DNA-binding NtrC family response regulator